MTFQINQIYGAFEPAKEITDPNKFTGRRAQIERGCELLTSKDHVFIYGIRGIGKSSLAIQLHRIATGDNTLLKSIDSPLKDQRYDFVTCFIACDDSIKNINALLYRLLRDQQGFAQWNSMLDLAEIGTFEITGALNPSLVSEFNNRAARLAAASNDGLVIFVDEFDRIKDQQGFASIVKSPPPKCTFVITGIGLTEKELVRDHESIVRKLDSGKLLVPNMSEPELRLIIERAEQEVEKAITFHPAVIERLIRISQGQPYLLQLVGKFCLLTTYKARQSEVSIDLLEKALREIAINKESFLEDQYIHAIKNSANREKVLRIFAQSETDPVNTSEAYKAAKEAGVNNPSFYVGELVREQYGAKLIKVAEQYYRIPDPLFKAYVAATPPRLEGQNHDDSPEESESGAVAIGSGNRNIINVVHLSDVHFGLVHYFSNLPIATDRVPDSDKPTFEKYISETLLPLPRQPGPDLIVFSGDFTQSAVTQEFNAAKFSIEKILSSLNLSAKRLILTPGNHDVNWAAQAADPADRKLPFMAYINFFSSLMGEPILMREPEKLFRVYDLTSDLNCIVLSLNSAVLESKEDHRGYIGATQMAEALAQVNRLPSDQNTIKIATFHHHLVPVSSLEADLSKNDEILRDAPYIKQSLLSAGFHLVLHGHRHHGHEEQVSDGQQRSLVVVGCGSSGVVQRERGAQPLQFNRIQIARVLNEHILITSTRHMFDAERRKWVHSEDHRAVFKMEFNKLVARR